MSSFFRDSSCSSFSLRSSSSFLHLRSVRILSFSWLLLSVCIMSVMSLLCCLCMSFCICMDICCWDFIMSSIACMLPSTFPAAFSFSSVSFSCCVPELCDCALGSFSACLASAFATCLGFSWLTSVCSSLARTSVLLFAPRVSSLTSSLSAVGSCLTLCSCLAFRGSSTSMPIALSFWNISVAGLGLSTASVRCVGVLGGLSDLALFVSLLRPVLS